MFVIKDTETGLYLSSPLGAVYWTEDKEKAQQYRLASTAQFVLRRINNPNCEIIIYDRS